MVESGVKLTQSCPILCDSVDCSLQTSLSIGFPKQEYWSGLPFPSSGDLPDLEIEPGPPVLQADSLPSEPPGKSLLFMTRGSFCVSHSGATSGTGAL